MSLAADSVKKLTEFLEQLDKKGITPTQFITSMQAAPAPSTIIVKKLPIHPETDTSKKFHGAVPPRDGGSDTHGVWVGKGKANKGLVAKGYYCCRDLDLDHKTLSEVNKITADCKKGLEAKPECRFMLATEETKTKLNDTLREMETFIIDHGMESCFNIITDTDSYNAFREFGRISDEVQATWIDDILRDGVRCGLNSRHELCPCDAENMELSGEAILNSCSPALKRTIMRELPAEDRNGISVFFSAVRHGRTHTNANVRKMCNELEQMDVRKYPGENAVAFCHDALDKVDEIRLAAQQLTDLENLTQLTVQGMSIGSDEGLRAEVRTIIKEANQPGSGVTPESATKQTIKHCEDAVTFQRCGPMRESKPPQAFQACVQQQINQATDRLTQVRNDGGRGGGGGRGSGGRGGGGRGGGAGRGSGPDRPRHVSPSSGDTGDAATNRKVNNMIKDYIAAHGNPEGNDDVHIKDENDDIVAKFCAKCKRWNKGDKLHCTRQCGRERPVDETPNPPSSQPNAEGNLAANDAASMASGGTSNLTDTGADSSTASGTQPAAGLMTLGAANYETPSARSANFGWVPRHGGRGH